jgi:sugar-phosphatase
MDGLMIDSEPLWWRVEHALAALHGVDWTDELARSCVGTGLANAIRAMQDAGLALPVDEGVSWLVDNFIERIGEVELKPGCLELLGAARAGSLQLALASSATVRLIDTVLEHFALRSAFDAVVSGETVPHPKPAPDIFLRAAELLGVAPSQAVVLEDSLAGIRAACAGGFAVIAVPEFHHERCALFTPHLVRDLHEARALLAL